MMHADDEIFHVTSRCLFPSIDYEPMTKTKTVTATASSLRSVQSALSLSPLEPVQSIMEIETHDVTPTKGRHSPTSVAMPLSSLIQQNNVPELRSKVTMCENGAEVTLEMTSLTTPEKVPLHHHSSQPKTLGEVRNIPLLDEEATPSPGFKRFSFRPIEACCPTTARGCWRDDTDHDPCNQQRLEKTITRFLEDPMHADGGCSGWQAWSYFGILDAEDDQHGDLKENIRRVLRNRAFDIGARKTRIQTLRHELDPFSDSPVNQQVQGIPTSRSFSIDDNASAIVRVSQDIPHRRGLAQILSSCTTARRTIRDSPVVLPHYPEDDICYDSDPEDFARRLSPSPSDLSGYDKENRVYTFPTPMAGTPNGDIVDSGNDEVFKTIAQELINQTATLILHPDTRQNGARTSSNPVAVKAWVERGQKLYTMIQPKFMWSLAHRKNKNGKNTVVVNANGIELLDITRILKVDKVDRRRYPFAKPRHCFMLKTIHQQDLLFEAKTVEEMERWVFSLKLVVARLGAKVIVSDQSLFDEFFSSPDGVPGEAPYWIHKEAQYRDI